MTKLVDSLCGKQSITLFCRSHVTVFYIDYSNTARVCWLDREKNQVILELKVKHAIHSIHNVLNQRRLIGVCSKNRHRKLVYVVESEVLASSLAKRSWSTSLQQTLRLRPLDLSGLTAPSIGYKTEGQRQATNEMTSSIDVLASVSLVTLNADLVIGVRKYYLTSKQPGKVLST